MVFVLTNFCILFLLNYLLKNLIYCRFLRGTTCVLFLSRFCIDSRFSTSKVVEGFFLQIIFMAVNENLSLLHKALQIQKFVPFSVVLKHLNSNNYPLCVSKISEFF